MMDTWNRALQDSQARDMIAAMPKGLKPREYIEALKGFTPACSHCDGTGTYLDPRGTCYRCEGKGHLTLSDAARFRSYTLWRKHG
jgi:hypothetical protein